MNRRVLPVLLLALLPVSARADSGDASDWLKRMASAIKTLNYEGTFVYISRQNIESLRIIHKADAQGEHERLYSLNGAAREIIRANDMLTCILPDNKSVVVERNRPRRYIPQALVDINPNVRQHYEFSVVGDDRVAGREAKLIAITPRDRYRYGFRIWLDQTNAMLLKSDVINEHGAVVERLMFTQLEFRDHIDTQALQAQNTGANYRRVELKSNPHTTPAHKHWTITRLPAGFQESLHAERRLPAGRAPAVHLILSDGLASVSVYIEKSEPGHKALEGVSTMGTVNAFGTMVQDHQVTVVGQVPRDTVVMIGRAVARKQP